MVEYAYPKPKSQLFIVEGKQLTVPGEAPKDVVTGMTVPDKGLFLLEEFSAWSCIMPNYHAPAPTKTPQYVTPKNFAEMKALEKAWHNFEIAYPRTPEANQAFKDRQRFFKEHNIEISDFIRKQVFKDANYAYVLRKDEFPADLPEGVDHYNLWLAHDNFSPDDKLLMVMDSMHAIGVYDPEKVVINEKKWRTRFPIHMTNGQEYTPGVKPSVQGVEHFHIKVAMNG